MAQTLQNDTILQDDKYRIIKKLGQGGFGITYLAENTVLEKEVAIKEFFPKDFCNREDSNCLRIGTESNRDIVSRLKTRFIKEARNIAKIDYPGIVKIYDIFSENNTSYYVMEYIEGENLNEKIKREGPLSEEKAIEYIKEVGAALEHIHSKNMTHFDVKPSNIVVRSRNDKPILIDFGLSKQFTQEGEATSTILPGVSHGYSPIELYNPAEDIVFSPQTDVYSLAATLYYLVEGKTPPTSLDLVSKELEFPKSISDGLKEIIIKGMATNKGNRVKSIILFLDIFSLGNSSLSLDNEETYLGEESESLDILKNKANLGDISAIYQLGLRYYEGKDVSPNYKEAMKWFKLGAEKGDKYSQNQLGHRYLYGEGIEQSDKEAFNWYKKSAEQGFHWAQKNLGLCYDKGRGVSQNKQKAYEWYLKAAEQGNPEAMTSLGDLYYDGEGVEKDYTKAFEWFKKAAELGNADAMNRIGVMYHEGKGVKQDYSEAFGWYKKAAEKNYDWALHNIGNAYYYGWGVEKDYTKAIEWYKKAAELGNANAMNYIGNMYWWGNGVPKDYVEANKWYQKAAQNNYDWAMYNIGNSYYDGKGVEKDYTKAFEWFKKAADNGHKNSQHMVGDLYYRGRGVEKSLVKAKEYWQKAAAQGDDTANKKSNSYLYRIYDIYSETIFAIGVFLFIVISNVIGIYIN